MFNLTIPIFDINKYTGRFYEIASIPLFYQNPCYFSEAVYTKDSNDVNKILVENICYDENNNLLFSRKGEAYIKNIEEPGKLYLKFTDNKLNDVNANDPDAFIKYSSNPGESPYFIHYTDYDNISIVGSPTGNYLWILSRHEQINMSTLKALTIYVKNLGYDLSKISCNPKRIKY